MNTSLASGLDELDGDPIFSRKVRGRGEKPKQKRRRGKPTHGQKKPKKKSRKNSHNRK
jgi:hypothetical protein